MRLMLVTVQILIVDSCGSLCNSCGSVKVCLLFQNWVTWSIFRSRGLTWLLGHVGVRLSVLCRSKRVNVWLPTSSLPSLFRLSFRVVVQFCYFCAAPVHNTCGSKFRFRSRSTSVKGVHSRLCSKPDRFSEETKEVHHQAGLRKT